MGGLRALFVVLLVTCVPVCMADVFAFSSVDPAATVASTLPLFARDMQEADAAGASWLLFPEFSLFSPETRNQTMAACADAPAVLAALGATLAKLRTLRYAMVNLCLVEHDANGTQLFNTNFVLSAETGGVVAQYRKVRGSDGGRGVCD